MKRPAKLFSYIFLSLFILLGSTLAQRVAVAATLKADYQFQGVRTSTLAGAPDLTDILGTNHDTGVANGANTFANQTVDGVFRPVLIFPNGNGLQMSYNNGFLSSTSYSVVIYCKIDRKDGRILNPKVGNANTQACGLFVLPGANAQDTNGYLSNFRMGDADNKGATPIPLNQYVQLVLTRGVESGTTFLSGYVNGTRQWHVQDSGTDATQYNGVIFNNTLHFFKGDTSEELGGAVARIRVYDGALTQTEVQGLATICHPLTLSPATLPAATVGVAYNQTVTVTDGQAPYTFEKSSGTMPAGLSISSSGVISGTPTKVGDPSFQVKATDANGCAGYAGYTISVRTASGSGTGDGRLAAWGYNSDGALGDNTENDSIVPVAVINSGVLANKLIKALVGGDSYSLALSSVGKVYGWGDNTYGQLGDGTSGLLNKTLVPIATDMSGLPTGVTFKAIAASKSFIYQHSLAIGSDGKVYAWGSNNDGELGTNSTSDSAVPVAVDTSGVLAGKMIVAIAAGEKHSLAVDSNGQAYAWGSNWSGELGDGSTPNVGTFSKIPVAVNMVGLPAGTKFVAVAAGYDFSVALTSTGKIYTWGDNGDGSLGNGTDGMGTDKNVPVAVDVSGLPASTVFKAISAGSSHVIALTTDGKVYAWGDNDYGQLGTGKDSDSFPPQPNSNVPVAVDMTSIYSFLAGRKVTAIAAAAYFNVVLGDDGKAYSWGDDSGKLGTGNDALDNQSTPVAVNMNGVLDNKVITLIGAGYDHSLVATAATDRYTAGNCPALPSGVRHWWRGDGNPIDSVGSADGIERDVTVTYQPGKVKQAFSFDGTERSDAIFPRESIELDVGNTFTVEFWVFPRVLDAANKHSIMGRYDDDTDPRFGTVSLLSDHIEYWQQSTKRVSSADGTVPINAWTHVALAYDGSVMRLYTNGVLRATSTAHTENFVDMDFEVGDAFGDTLGTEHFNGMVDELALFNRALTVTEIKAIFDAGDGGKCLAPCPAISLSPSTLPNGTTGTAYTKTITASGGTGPYTFSADTLPPGLTLAPGGVLSGTPTIGGTFDFTVTATDSSGCAGTKDYALVVALACVTPASGLVHWWPGEGNAKDIIGTAHGTVEPNDIVPLPDGSTPMTFDPGKVGKAFQFDYADNIVDIPSINLGDHFTIEFWLWPYWSLLSDNYDYENLISNDAASATNYGALKYHSGSTRLEYFQNNQLLLSSPGGSVTEQQWYHVAITSNGISLSLYLNGQLQQSAITGITFNNASKFGWSVVPQGGEDRFRGYLDEVSYYNVDLSQAQLQAIYNADDRGKCIPCPTITLAPSTLPDGSTNNAYSETITVAGGSGSYTFTKSAGTLPTGLTLTSGGKLSGTPTAGGTFNFTVTATDTSGCKGSRAYTVMVQVCPSITLSPVNLPDATLNQSYSKTITASGGVAPYTFAKAAGTLPTGITLSTGGVLSGTPTAQGTFNFTVRATDANGCASTRAYRLDVCSAITLAPVALPDGSVGSAYNQTITATGGAAPYTFAKSAGTLPTGLTLSPDGVLSGTPSAGSFSFTVRATDANGCTGTRAYTLSFCSNLTLSPATLPSGKVGVAYNQTLTPGGGTTPYTIAKTAGTLPLGLSLSAGGVLSGTPTLTGIYNFTVTVTDANGIGCARSRVYRIIINLAAGASGNAMSWGRGVEGQLGNGTSGEGASRNVPVDVDVMGVLNGKLVTAVAAGDNFSLALTSDGKVYAWGKNTSGALGNGDGGYDAGIEGPRSTVPIAVDMSGALAGKTVVAIAAGSQHALALTSDGKVYAWGNDRYGQIGDGGNEFDPTKLHPVAVDTSGVLAGKTVIAIAAGGLHSLALTSDGKVYGWGWDLFGQLGNDPTDPNSAESHTLSPVAVRMTGPLSGKHVTAIAAGYTNSLALTSEGKVVAWGSEYLGNGTNTRSYVPVAVLTGGVLRGKIVTAIAGGIGHSLALTADGKIAAWGTNDRGQLGNNSFALSEVPVAVRMVGPLNGNTAIAIAAGAYHSLAISSQGKACAWGDSSEGQLGNGSNTNSAIPVAVKTNGVLAGTVVTGIAGGNYHSLAIAAGPCPTIALAPQTPLSALVGVAYSQAITATGGRSPYTFAITEGQLPKEFTFSNGGVLSGTASVVGSHTFTVQATDANGCTGRRIFTLNISGDCARLPSGIVAWWKAENNANDSIGTNHGATSNVTYTTGESGKAFRFTVSSSQVTIPDAPALRPAKLSLEAWVRFESLEPPDQFGEEYLVYKNSGFGSSYALVKTRIQKVDGTKEDRFAFRYALGGSQYFRPVGTTKIEIGQFYHVVGTFDGTTGRLYVNGVLEDEFTNPTPGALNYDSTPLRFGSLTSGGNGFLLGRLDEVALYNRPLDIEEVQSLYQAGTNGKCLSYIVTNTNDSGAGSLRAAMSFANANSHVTILFNIPETDAGFSATSGAFTIKPLTPLPVLTSDGTTIDGSTQRAFTSDSNVSGPEILVNGASAGTSAHGLQITAANCLVRELTINGFALDGVRISGAGATGNTIESCYIGASARASAPVANNIGLHIRQGAHDNFIGGTSAAQRNVISGNKLYGVWIEDAGSDANQVLGNYIGTNRLGTTALANGLYGVYIDGSSNNIIGRTAINSRNRIAFNGSDGIFIAAGTGNVLRGNFLFSNTGLGIDLAPNGVTANDAGDGDAGANNLQNAPVITAVTVSGGNTTITGTLNSTPNKEFEVDIYRNPGAATAGDAEGELYAGTDTTVTTGGAGNATFSLNLNGDFTGQFFTATANRESTGDTSEFSPAQRYVCPLIAVSPAVLPDGTVDVSYSKTITASGGTGPYSFAVTVGSLPSGLALSSAGVLSGTPTAQGSFNFTVKATDAKGCSGSRAYNLNVTCSGASAPSGLVSWWPGDGNANDIQGGNHGTLAGNATATGTGKVGQCFSFGSNQSDFFNDAVTVGSPASLELTQGITIDAWINPVNVPNGQLAAIVTKWAQNFQDMNPSDSYGLWLSWDGVQAHLFSAIHQTGATEPSISGGNVPLNAWSHVAMTFDAASGAYRLYLNGEQVASTTAVGTLYPSDATFSVGRESSSAIRNFHGLIDEVDVFSRALSADEIAAIYSAGAAGKCKSSP